MQKPKYSLHKDNNIKFAKIIEERLPMWALLSNLQNRCLNYIGYLLNNTYMNKTNTHKRRSEDHIFVINTQVLSF